MVDLHSHYLYGVDDGAKSLEMSLELLAQAKSLGISRLLATPHVNAHTTPQAEEQILNTFKVLSALFDKKGIPVQIKLAAEVNLIGSDINWIDHNWVLIGDNQQYILVETPFHQMPLDFSEILFRIRLKKIIPILAHPERNIGFQDNPEQLVEWIHQGALVQADAGSFTGQFGKQCQRFSERLLKAGAVHLVASDAHDPKGRNYRVLKDAYTKICSDFTEDYAKRLFDDNPKRIWKGETVNAGIEDDSVLQLSMMDKIRQVFKNA